MARFKPKGQITRRIESKLKTRGLLTFLAFASIIGLAFTSIQFFTGTSLGDSLPYALILIGIGLIFESRVNALIKGRTTSPIAKIFTLLMGVGVLIGGILTLPFINVMVSPQLTGVLGLSNIGALLAIAYELFLID